MADIKEREEVLTKELNEVIKKLYKELDGDEETKKRAIQSKVDKAINKNIRSSTQPKKMDVERAEKRKQREKKEEMFLTMAKNLETTQKIMEVTGYSQPSVSRKFKKTGIYSRTRVIELLKTQTDEQIASEGQVNIEAVARIREERNAKIEEKMMQKEAKKQDEIIEREAKRQEEQQQQQKTQVEIDRNKQEEQPKRQVEIDREKQEEQIKRQAEIVGREEQQQREEQEFINMARNLTDPRTISSKLGKRLDVIYGRIEYYGFYTRKDVVPLLSKFSDEEIAAKGKLDKEAVEMVRLQEQGKEKLQNTTEAINKTLNRQRSEILEQNEFLRTAKRYKSIDDWEQKSGVNKYEIIVGLKRLIRKGIATKEQIALIDEWEARRAAKNIPTKKREVDLKLERIKLKAEIKNIGLGNEGKKTLITYIINKILVEYEDILTESDCALIAYAYMKIREFYRGLEFSKIHLNLKDISIDGVRNRIDEIIRDEEERKTLKLSPEVKVRTDGEER